MGAGIVVLIIVLILVVIMLAKAATVIHQAEKGLVERFGRYRETLEPGLRFIMPFVDSVIARIDMRETVLDVEPQPVITNRNMNQGVKNHRYNAEIVHIAALIAIWKDGMR